MSQLKSRQQGDVGKLIRKTSARELMADLYDALTDEWQTTQAVAQRAGYEWQPGSSWNAYARSHLFALLVHAPDVEHHPRKNGHLWRRKES